LSIHRALRVTGLASAIGFVLAFASSIILSRLLTPKEIGIYSISVSLLTFGHVIRDFGVGQYLVKQKELTEQDLRAAFTVLLITSWSIAALMLLLGPLAADFYGHPEIYRVFQALAASFACIPFGAHILSFLKREMAFDTAARVNIASSLVQTLVTLGGAWAGASYMSLAWGSLAGALTTVLSLFIARPQLALLRPTLKGLGPVLRFGGTASSASIIARLGEAGPDLVLGRTMSVEAVAHFSRANSPISMVVEKVNEILMQVFGPAFAQGLRNQQDPGSMLARAIEAHTGLLIPLTLLLALISEPMILLLFGDQWTIAAQMAPWLTLWTVLVAPVQLAWSALMAGGHAQAFLRASVLSNLVLLLTLMASPFLSLQQLAMSFVAARVATLFAWELELSRHYAFGWRQLWQASRASLGLGLLTAVPAAACAWGLHAWLALAHPFWQIMLIGGAGSVAYVLALRSGRFPVRDELLRLAPPLGWLLGGRAP
jgi:O-antigen/teichoic acid export membrane protein